MTSAGFRASIPSSVKKTIQNIKEITGNHSDEDIYAMLKECSMDPNETTQKLLLQDTFHEVKRKRDRRKEILNNRESMEPRWRPGTQGRGLRGGRGNFSPHNVSYDAGSSKNSGTGKDNGTHQVTEKVAPPLAASQETISKEKSSGTSSAPIIANGPTSVASGTTSGVTPSPSSAGSGDIMGPSSEPVPVPSEDLWFPGAVGAIRHEVGSQQSLGELNALNSAETKLTAASETGSSFVQGKIQGKSQGVAKIHVTEMAPTSSTVTHGSPSSSRPSSNYSSRSQQLVGPQKAGSNKEWKPKPTNTINQGSGTASASEAPSVSAKVTGQLLSASSALDSEEATSKLQRKLEDFHLPQRQHVILPNHIIVPDSEKNKFSFGSLGVTFGVNANYVSGPESEKSSTYLSETSQDIEETVGEQDSSQNAVVTSEVGDYPDHPESPTNVPENLSSSEVDGSSGAIQEYNESKQDTALPSGGHQYSGVHTSPNYNFGFVPPMLGTQVTPLDNSESQTRDISRLPSYVVHQPFDPTSYYAQFYRSGADSDGHLSPFPSAGPTTKYNGNVTVLPAPNSQSPQEGGVLSSTSPSPLVTQAAGLMQSSIAVTQQPVPVFRPTGVHLSHYPPNYIPYGHYFSPYYVPPPAIHQFLGNGAFPQQPQASTVYPPPPAMAAAGMKYPLSHFKPGANAANPTHLVMPSAYGVYGSSPAGYSHNSATTAGNSASNEDLGSSQFKESNVYISGQQSEGSAVWLAAPGRDISNLPTSSFYNVPPQGQHVTFAPTQAGHGTFAGIYHPAQTVTAAAVHPLLQQSQTMAGAVDMVGPGGNVYQQPQHAQMNWPSNY
ncbi:GBF-interacting protein 1-like isoform X2 [Gastrolobium bilobum]|uniref:GBF-interacting protein 1-like isoform X2 n=1 Tax=Gastrolobium bilobum TaxID=150636 RepID=UPI002AB15B02|nr:GBF-interacting protein 1-like isoform X2 [Gastrolobium bilobum]